MTVGEDPVIGFGKMSFEESKYQRGDKFWFATTLLRECQKQGLEPFEYPVACYDMSVNHFPVTCADDFIWQMKRTLEADYKKYPIIIDDLGQIADGNHRICHAILDGKTSVLAYRLITMPAPDYIQKDET